MIENESFIDNNRNRQFDFVSKFILVFSAGRFDFLEYLANEIFFGRSDMPPRTKESGGLIRKKNTRRRLRYQNHLGAVLRNGTKVLCFSRERIRFSFILSFLWELLPLVLYFIPINKTIPNSFLDESYVHEARIIA